MESQERYKRQIAIDGWGEAVQKRLGKARVCITGVGGLGSPASLYLAAAGVGSIVLCDFQEIELSNLNRQVLYSEAAIGSKKVNKARERLKQLNSTINIEICDVRIDESSAQRVFASSDLIIDCLDNFETRYVLNRYSIKNSIPLIHAGITEFYGQLALIHPPNTPCLECFIPADSPKQKGSPPVLGATAGVVGSLQAITAIKVLGGFRSPGFGVLQTVDLLNMSFDSISIEKNPACPACGPSA